MPPFFELKDSNGPSTASLLKVSTLGRKGESGTSVSTKTNYNAPNFGDILGINQDYS
jgi:hypothetical protein